VPRITPLQLEVLEGFTGRKKKLHGLQNPGFFVRVARLGDQRCKLRPFEELLDEGGTA
jgi:hypothetical protein